MTDRAIPEEHIRETAREIVAENNGIAPSSPTPSMVDVALETSDVDLDAMDDESYNVLWNNTKLMLEDVLPEEEDSGREVRHRRDALLGLDRAVRHLEQLADEYPDRYGGPYRRAETVRIDLRIEDEYEGVN